MLSRSTSTSWSGLLRHALNATLVASKGSKSGHQAKTIPNLCSSYPVHTWTLLAEDTGRLQSFHMSCQRQILGVKWQDHVKNIDIADRTGLPSIADIISKRRQALFGHVVRLDATTPAHQALCQVIAMKGGQSPGNWRRPPGRPRKTWIQQIGNETHCRVSYFANILLTGINIFYYLHLHLGSK